METPSSRARGPARRIVALAPNLVELAYAAGAGDRLVGASEASDYPEAARALPRVADASSVDMERLVALRPDLVLAWRSGNPPRAVETLRRLGVAVHVSEVETPLDIARVVVEIGTLAGTQAVAHRIGDALTARWSALVEAHRADRPIRVFFEIWHAPPTTIGARHMLAFALDACGAKPVLADERAMAASVDPEALFAADPDLVLAAWGANDAEVRGAWARHKGLRAVREGRVFWVDADTLQRASPRFMDGAEGLCALLARERARVARR